MTLDFGVYGKLKGEMNKEVIESLPDHPTAGDVFYYETLGDQVGKEGYTMSELNEKDLDFILTVGGDGTILRLLQETDKNVLGINTGKVGFLTAMEIARIDEALRKVNRGDYFVDERIKLKVMVNGEFKGECTNEAVIHTESIAKMRHFEVFQEDVEIDSFRADGLIVSTPTGSTCYSMSAGGPIVDPTVDAFVVVPISPYKLAVKPFVVPVDKDIGVSVNGKGKSSILVLDGQKKFQVSSEDELTFNLADRKAKFISFEKDFYNKIKKKLVWR
ncbi:MAG: NAD(+)/NADH kinase [Candidatus Saliniplasma sp.]